MQRPFELLLVLARWAFNDNEAAGIAAIVSNFDVETSLFMPST